MFEFLAIKARTNSAVIAWYARGDSNSRTRLRRPVLYPLSYGRVPGDYTDPVGRPATPGLSQIHHLKKCKTSLEPAVKAGYDDL